MDYRRKIYSIRDLPTLPIIAQKILAVVDQDSSAAEKLARIIENDQSLAVRILSLANSAYYGRRAQVATIKQAVVVIGWVMLKQVSLGVLMSRTLGTGKDRVEFWRHSLMAAHSASLTLQRSGAKNSDVAFTGGLLHDVGKLVLDTTLPAEYQKVRELVEQSGCSLPEAERSIFETDHAEVGAWMAERWQFPPELVGAIGQHHKPEGVKGPHAKLIAAVYAANVIAHASDALAQSPDSPLSIELPDPVRTTLGATPESLSAVLIELERRRKDIEHLLA